jgi:hypothetical protein
MNAIAQSSTLMAASNQWASRPADERFLSLTEMSDHFQSIRDRSRGHVLSNRRLRAVPVEGTNHKGLAIQAQLPGRPSADLEVALPTHWSFGQLAERASAPASYLRKLPAELSADCVNYGLRQRDIEDIGLLVRDEPTGHAATLAAATGPTYGRIWNADVVDALIHHFGDGITGGGSTGAHFVVPGEFGKAVAVDRQNTTLYASDRDFFVFLADEQNRIDLPGRRPGLTGSLARGFFVWNSEVGSATFGIATFLFDYVCCNRIVWGSTEYKEVRIRHTAGAPDRYLEEVKPALISMANSSTHSITAAIENARQARLDDIDDFLGQRFSRGQVAGIKLAHEADESRPIETVWDAVTGITAYARGIPNQDRRVEVERVAGVLLQKAA